MGYRHLPHMWEQGCWMLESRFREKDLTGVQAMKQRQRDLIRQETENRTQAE